MSEQKTYLGIMKFMKWIPGGTLIVPMLLTAIINTVWPDALSIGGTTTPLFKNGSMAIIGFILFCSGASINPKMLYELFKKSGVYFAMKIGIMVVVAAIAQYLLPPVIAFGVPAAVFFAIMTSTNPGTYLEQMERYGTDLDRATFPLVHLSTTVAVPVLVYGLVGAGAGDFDGMAMLALFVPFLVGFLLGNLDPAFAKFFKPGVSLMIPVLGANFGASMNLVDAVVNGAVPGIIMSVLYLVVVLGLFFLVDKLVLKRPGYQGVAWCSVSGSCAAIPPLIMAGNPTLEAFIPVGVAMVTTATIVTNLIMPLVNKKIVATWGDANGDRHLPASAAGEAPSARSSNPSGQA